MALGSHLITVRRLEKYINDVIGKKANLPDTSKTIIENISQINSDLSDIIQIKTIYKQGITITANAETSVDFTSEIASATPNGYKFIGMSFCGAYPNATWYGSVSITPCALSPTDKSVKFTTTYTQAYNLCMMGVFIRDI